MSCWGMVGWCMLFCVCRCIFKDTRWSRMEHNVCYVSFTVMWCYTLSLYFYLYMYVLFLPNLGMNCEFEFTFIQPLCQCPGTSDNIQCLSPPKWIMSKSWIYFGFLSTSYYNCVYDCVCSMYPIYNCKRVMNEIKPLISLYSWLLRKKFRCPNDQRWYLLSKNSFSDWWYMRRFCCFISIYPECYNICD